MKIHNTARSGKSLDIVVRVVGRVEKCVLIVGKENTPTKWKKILKEVRVLGFEQDKTNDERKVR